MSIISNDSKLFGNRTIKRKEHNEMKVNLKSANNMNLSESGESEGQGIKRPRRSAMKLNALKKIPNTQTKSYEAEQMTSYDSNVLDNQTKKIEQKGPKEAKINLKSENLNSSESGDNTVESVEQGIKRQRSPAMKVLIYKQIQQSQVKNFEAEKIIASYHNKKGEQVFVIKLKNTDLHTELKVPKAHKKYPQLVIQYYESRVSFKDDQEI